ncbi:hypothetical protein N7456_003316 [Penicillium angulare]|uniref:Uncharacterized protein n=1 Tax=Penicillium angulare TaxID=116970 RepID=A0A9W9FUE9_9EURO|nr:hypothetical protein N7456_003316 [Penicillium angulare]
MGWFAADSEPVKAHHEVMTAPPDAVFSTELLGAAAAQEAAKTFEDFVADMGKPKSRGEAEKIISRLVGPFVDEIGGFKEWDAASKQKAKDGSRKFTDKCLDELY